MAGDRVDASLLRPNGVVGRVRNLLVRGYAFDMSPYMWLCLFGGFIM